MGMPNADGTSPQRARIKWSRLISDDIRGVSAIDSEIPTGVEDKRSAQEPFHAIYRTAENITVKAWTDFARDVGNCAN